MIQAILFLFALIYLQTSAPVADVIGYTVVAFFLLLFVAGNIRANGTRYALWLLVLVCFSSVTAHVGKDPELSINVVKALGIGLAVYLSAKLIRQGR